MGHALVESLLIAFENEVRQTGVSFGARGLGQRRAELGELIEIALQKEQVVAVERVEIAVEKLAGELVIQHLVGKLRVFENLGGQRGGGGVGRLGIERIRLPETERSGGGDQRGADGNSRNDGREQGFHGVAGEIRQQQQCLFSP